MGILVRGSGFAVQGFLIRAGVGRDSDVGMMGVRDSEAGELFA
jgi:hypothetical protein